MEASWWTEFRTLSECRSVLFLCCRHILIFFDNMKNTLPLEKKLPLEASVEQNSDHCSECRSLLYFCNHYILIFWIIMKNPWPLEASWCAEFRTLVRMSKCIIFMHLPYTKFLRYHTKSIVVGSVLMSRIQNTFQIVQVHYFYAAAIGQSS